MLKTWMIAALALALVSAPALAETTKAQTKPYDEVVAACDAAADKDESCDYSTNDDGVLTGCFNGQEGPCFQCKPDGTRTCQILLTTQVRGTVRQGFQQSFGSFNPQPDPPAPQGGSLSGASDSVSGTPTAIIY
jgi:hypothetical protein